MKKATGHSTWTVYISLCDYLSRDKSVQSNHLSWLALPTVAIGAHVFGLCSFSANGEQWKVIYKPGVSSHMTLMLLSQVIPVWLKSTWDDWSTEHKCSFPSYPRGSGLRHVLSQQKTEGFLWESVAKYPKSNGELSVTSDELWDLWEWSRREAEEAGMCQSPALHPVSYSWIAGAAPCPHLHCLDQLLG